MTKEFFKNLPDTSTPFTAERFNRLFDGGEPLGKIVVEDVICKNILNASIPTGATAIWTKSGTTYYYTASSAWQRVFWNIKVKKGEQLTFSFKQRNNENVYVYISERTENDESLRSIVADGTNNIYTFTIENDCVLRISLQNGATVSNVAFEELQLERGDTKSDCVVYKKYGSEKEELSNFATSDIENFDVTRFKLYRDGDVFNLRGSITLNSVQPSGTVLFKIPQKYAPTFDSVREACVGAGGSIIYTSLNTSGELTVQSETGWVGLNMTWIRF